MPPIIDTLDDWQAQTDPIDLLSAVPKRKGQARRCRRAAAGMIRELLRLPVGIVLAVLPETGYDETHVRAAARNRLFRRSLIRSDATEALREVAEDLETTELDESCFQWHQLCAAGAGRLRWLGVGVPDTIFEGTHWPPLGVIAGRSLLLEATSPARLCRTVRLLAWLGRVSPCDTVEVVLFRRRLAGIVRDVFLPPVGIAGGKVLHRRLDPAWRTGAVLAMARTMWDANDFSAMPILADALQDAGCNREDILDHCRDLDQPHCRGCWVVDAILHPGE